MSSTDQPRHPAHFVLLALTTRIMVPQQPATVSHALLGRILQAMGPLYAISALQGNMVTSQDRDRTFIAISAVETRTVQPQAQTHAQAVLMGRSAQQVPPYAFHVVMAFTIPQAGRVVNNAQTPNPCN